MLTAQFGVDDGDVARGVFLVLCTFCRNIDKFTGILLHSQEICDEEKQCRVGMLRMIR